MPRKPNPVTSVNGVAGKLCKRCGNWKPLEEFNKNSQHRDGRAAWCRQCNSSYCVQWSVDNAEYKREQRVLDYANNSERYKANAHGWRLANPERKKRVDRDYAREHPGVRLKATRKFKQGHREQLRAESRDYYAEHRDERLAYSREWGHKNPGKRRTYTANRRARKLGVPCTLGDTQWNWLLEVTGHQCLALGKHRGNLEQDHIVPLNPGTHALDNIQPLCAKHNREKARKTIDYRPDWLKQLIRQYQCQNSETPQTTLGSSGDETSNPARPAQTFCPPTSPIQPILL